MPDIWTIVSTATGVLGLAYALYQGHEKRKLESYNRSQAWYLYSKTNNMLGITQVALSKYKELHSDNLNPEVLELLSKASAHGSDLFRESARSIQFSEEEFTEEAVERWVRMGKIEGDNHRSMFVPLMSDNKKHNKVVRFFTTPLFSSKRGGESAKQSGTT